MALPLPSQSFSIVKDIGSLLKQSVLEFIDDKALKMSAALSYYTAFSLAPLLVVLVGVLGIVMDQAVARSQLINEIEQMVGSQAAELVDEMVQGALLSGSGVLATIIGVLGLFFGATIVFVQLQDSLNTMWGVKPDPARGIKGVVFARVAAFATLVGVGFVLLISLVATAVIEGVAEYATQRLPIPAFSLQLLNQAMSLLATTGLFGLLYRYVPDVRIAWRDVWVGAVITAVLFALGKYGIGLYLGRGSAASAYGAAGSLAVLLLWVYYSSLVIFFGAEIAQVYANRFGSGIVPAAHAVYLNPPEEEEENPETEVENPAPAPVVWPSRIEPKESTVPWVLKALALLSVGWIIGRRR